MVIQLPTLRIDHLLALTDDTGIFQHAKFCIPRRNEGYTTDDNARALVACTRYYLLKNDPEMKQLASIYLAFLNHMQKVDGNFHNYLSFERTFLDVDGSEDCIGRTLWGSAVAMNSTLPYDMRMVAKDIFDRGLSWVWKTTHLRFIAFTIMGLFEYYQVLPDNNIKLNVARLADGLVKRYQDEIKGEWHWFEPYLTYDNARLSQAMFLAYSLTGEHKYLNVAKESLDFLVKTHIIDGIFVPIGNGGWYKRGENRAIYDQQPLEAAAMVDVAVDAYYSTKDKNNLDIANTAFGWFIGKNSRNMMIYNPETSGCRDGLASDKVNPNQGAESSISYLLARLKLEELKLSKKTGERSFVRLTA